MTIRSQIPQHLSGMGGMDECGQGIISIHIREIHYSISRLEHPRLLLGVCLRLAVYCIPKQESWFCKLLAIQ
ncbi:uncharacterized protein M6B38_368640 [Iris pallida]|uniref:Uncharacterized protein n=1 Tax=Iris pallida TaxID=29817 RepID=A0AAX6GGF7_IRIPA|nr:uncharacterized protein M6B38_368640 [Iris pallida]